MPDNIIEPLLLRARGILNFSERSKKGSGKVLFLVMYDIEDNKVRRYIVKYLEKHGCLRIQKSIFPANQSESVFNEISNTLEEVQGVYENNDSIIVMPISIEQLNAMKIIGNNINIDIITQSKSTMFF